MVKEAVDFITLLVQEVPELSSVLAEHMDENDEILPHVLMGDITRLACAKMENDPDSPSVRALLNRLEAAYAFGSEPVKELISVSFLENLADESTAAAFVVGHIGPNLSVAYRKIIDFVP